MTQTSSSTTELHVCAFAYKFTGKERDAESGLDYFGARYYASSMGRFMSPDWSKSPDAVPYASLDNPQTLNLYVYGHNNPLSNIDADGHNAFTDFFVHAWQRIDNSAHGFGFHTNDQVDQILENDRNFLKNNTSINLENLSSKQVYDVTNAIQAGKSSIISGRVKFILDAAMLTQWGWEGQKGYNDLVNRLRTPNTPEGTVDLRPESMGGKTPTEAEARQLIQDAGGTPRGGVEQHEPGGVSTYTDPHINYTLADGTKGTIEVQK